ncbi:DUF3800 domain-containing protein [Sphingomonas aliaeris]|uniref:DUF3800 domain-containing protein n=1 Tax=Sphingomonas aliaeris TaxID=2759526 RepID=A0A974S5P3_9SPHN|nr:DUF3800 domain-containing protein [Sphingomonas aliaeris]QQV78611.1 DUF3800 domain-containing protein [Sphingomonas aliaeris]
MYYIYTDEAGTSRPEPVCVVAAVLIQADRHWQKAASMLEEVLDLMVPEKLRPGFIFHAKTVLNGYREFDAVWPKDERVGLIGMVASIPQALKTAIVIGKVRRDSPVPQQFSSKPEDYHHLLAFHLCMARANKYIKDHGQIDEIATIVAEDIPKKKNLLREIIKVSLNEIDINEHNVIVTKKDRIAGRILQTNATVIDRVIDTIHFCEKNQAPLLQIADACAYSFRRYLAQQSDGDLLVHSILKSDLIWSEWQGPASSWVFSFDPKHYAP